MSFVQGTGPVGGTGAGEGIGEEARGESSGTSRSLLPDALDVAGPSASCPSVAGRPGGGPSVAGLSTACPSVASGSVAARSVVGSPGVVAPTAPGCGAGSGGAAGDGETC